MTPKPVVFEDYQEISDLMRRLGMVIPETNATARRLWSGLWLENPAFLHYEQRPVFGWKVESKARIVGFFGNIPQVYWLGNKKIKVSVARAWAVEKGFRSSVADLCAAFFNQEEIDLAIISSANKAASERCKQFGSFQMPEASYREVLYWIVSPARFTRSVFTKIGIPRVLHGMSEWATVFPIRSLLIGKMGHQVREEIKVLPITTLGKDFDEFWKKMKVNYPSRLLATRDSVTLKWYFGLNTNSGLVKVLACFDRDELMGYAVVIRDDVLKIQLKRLKIADFVVLGSDERTAKKLLIAAFFEASDQGCHIMELTGLPPFIRDFAYKLRPFRRMMPIFPFYFKALSQDLSDQLLNPNSWYVTAYDGDTAIY